MILASAAWGGMIASTVLPARRLNERPLHERAYHRAGGHQRSKQSPGKAGCSVGEPGGKGETRGTVQALFRVGVPKLSVTRIYTNPNYNMANYPDAMES